MQDTGLFTGNLTDADIESSNFSYNSVQDDNMIFDFKLGSFKIS
eukprot:CAMPEP_0114597088 /NCGR_PEP_ID=MMETSP0125-20121206/19323_1 /TAXON_ID=485358 ORGANISM="Aristerostoma sp., Strain ATCC 50986" /NCGR_SAMPLE_ID=MMETSP0125 /ASSEMBLY_ACC=CAM_ASM_000245 /LENGTH=43 /DNA_ID= /DNA_START= /DNA_END= /DNA_ORIENTATION=